MRPIARFGMFGFGVVLLITGMIQILGASPTLAATINDLTVTCQYVNVRGRTEVNTSFVRVQVVLGSDLTHVLAQQVVRTRPRAGAAYSASLSIRKAHLAEGTHIVIAVGEWDGTKYLRPANIIGVDCDRTTGVPTPVMTPTPTFVASPTFGPTFTLPPMSPTPPPTPVS